MITRRIFGLSLAGVGLSATSAFARRSAIAVPLTIGERILMDVSLNGQGPFPFALDTGAVVSGVKQAVAERLGLPTLRQVRLNGVNFPLHSVSEMVLGGTVRQENAALFGLPGERLGAEGLLAAGLLTTYDSELDFERSEWRVHPEGGPDRTGFERLPSELRARGPGSDRPFADVVLDGETLRPLWDTGAPRALSLPYRIGRRLGLWRDDRPFGSVLVTGIQGASDQPGRIVRAGRLTIGASVYERPLVLVRPEGHPADEIFLGLPILRTLNLSLDRSERSVWVRRNSLEPGREPRYGPSGAWLEAAAGGVRVASVSPRSPAAEAGVLVGDMVQGPGGLRGAIDRLGGLAGAQRELTVSRGGETLTLRFTLADYL